MFLILSLMLFVQSEDIKNLRDKNPIVRRNAISTLAEKDAKEAIRAIIDLLGSERDETVLNAAADALERLTGVRANGSDFAKWQKFPADLPLIGDDDFYDLPEYHAKT